MVTVKYKLGKKKCGNWLLPLEYFVAEFTAPKEDVRPYFKFEKEYFFPERIYFGTDADLEKKGVGSYCKSIARGSNKILDLSFYIEKQETNRNISIDILRKIVKCQIQCVNCKICLGFREGNPPDYSDVEQLFQQIANDIIDAYNKAVEKALNYGDTEEKEFCITNESNFDIKQQQEEAKPVRKINI